MNATARAAAALLLTLLWGCGTSPVTTIQPPPPPPAVGTLWTVSGSAAAILGLDTLQLKHTGTIDPATAITTPSAQLLSPGAVAFDQAGTLWLVNRNDSRLLGFSQASLAGTGAAAATVVISFADGTLLQPTALAFDPAHRLWVANSGNGTLIRFDPAQLATSGSPQPAVVLTGMGHPAGIAFDAAGNLWVTDNQLSTVSEFLSTQLTTSSTPTPVTQLNSNGSSLFSPFGLAFDAAGRLWVANPGNQTVVGYAPAQLLTSGHPDPMVVLSANGESLQLPVDIAFDAGGNLWVSNPDGIVEKVAGTALATSTPVVAAVRLTFNNKKGVRGLAWWPVPPGLPLH